MSKERCLAALLFCPEGEAVQVWAQVPVQAEEPHAAKLDEFIASVKAEIADRR